MIKSIKGQFINSVIIACLFVIASFSYLEFTDKKSSLFGPVFFYTFMILAVFNAGLYTQKYLQSKKDNAT